MLRILISRAGRTAIHFCISGQVAHGVIHACFWLQGLAQNASLIVMTVPDEKLTCWFLKTAPKCNMLRDGELFQ